MTTANPNAPPTPARLKHARKLHEEIGLSISEIALRTGMARTTIRDCAQREKWVRLVTEDSTFVDPLDPKTVAIENLEARLQRERLQASRARSLYKSLRVRYDELLARSGIIKDAGPPTIRKILTKQKTGATEGTIVMPASDWHVEEEVRATDVNSLNEFNRHICDARVKKYFKSAERLIRLFKQDLKIEHIVFPLLGDFITNDIHPEMSETATDLPMDAVIIAQGYLASGISFLLENTDCSIHIPCHSGNHGRTTRQVHVTTEHGHSLE